MFDSNRVTATRQGVGFGKLDTPHFRRLKTQLKGLAALGQRALTGCQGHHRLVSRHRSTTRASNQTGLRQIHTVFAFVEQDDIAGCIYHVDMFEKLGLNQRATFGVKRELEHISLRGHTLTRHCRRTRR